MDFKLTREQEELRMAAREFAEKEFPKYRDKLLEAEASESWYPRELVNKARSLGFIGVHFPEEYGGQGLGVLENSLIVEEFCRADPSLAFCILSADFACEIIMRHGSEEQKQKYLTQVTKGEGVSAGAFTEPDHGSDLTSLSTIARREGDCYVINGVKTFITNAPIATFMVVLCQTNPEAKPPYRGQSVFVVDRGAENIEVNEIKRKMGLRLSPTGEIAFVNTKVGKDSLVGEEGKGFYYALEFFDESRIEIAAQAVGIAQGAFERALRYSKERRQFGRRIADFQVIRHMLADMAMKIETARLLTYKAAWAYDEGLKNPALSSMAKAYASQVAVEVTHDAIQILGGYGYIGDYDVERYYRDARITEIYEGTTEIQKNTIADYLIEGK